MPTNLGRVATTGVRDGSAHSIKPEWFAGQREAQLGKAACVTQFGVNHVSLQAGAWTSLRHWHEREDEFVYVLDGDVVLIDEHGEHPLQAHEFVGFPAAEPNGHHFVNRSAAPATLLIVGTRHAGVERIHYPDDRAEVVEITRDARGVRVR